MIQFRIENESDKRLVVYLSSITPRLMAEIKLAFKKFGYMGANLSVTRYMTAGQSIQKGSKAGELLSRRTGTLARSISASVEPGYSETETSVSQTWGPNVPYGAIHEYGGWAGRGHRSYIPPRPYLGPALRDMQPELMAMIEEAAARAVAS